MYTIGIYARKSVYRDNSDSVQVQVKSCKEYANLVFRDREIEFKIYDQDEGFSGKDTNRPSFHALMRDIKAHMLDAVMVYKLDRISRSVKDFSETYEIMNRNEVSFLSVKESFDTSTPIGRTVMYILAAFAQLERENTSERVTDSMYALGAAGKWTGGKTPAGMKSIRKIIGEKEHSFLIQNEETIKTVKLIYELFLSGHTITWIERYCRDNGIRSESGKFLNTSQINFIMSNPVYCCNDLDAYFYFKEKGYKIPDKQYFDGKKGLMGYGRTKQHDSSRTKKNCNWTLALGIHEPLLSGADWIKVQERFGQNKMYRRAKYEAGILKGVLKCSCGSKIDVRNDIKNGITFSYYYCAKMHRAGKDFCDSGYTRIEKIDNAFIQKLKDIKLNPEKISLKEAELIPISTENLNKELKIVNESIENLTAALMDNMQSSASAYIIAKIEKLDLERMKLETAIQKSEITDRSRQSALETRDQIYSNICNILDNFEIMSYREKNELIKRTVKKCEFDGENLHITF